MPNTPLVSTVTPCFRMKRYLPAFLEWLPKQTFFEQLEVVLDHNEPDEEEIGWIRDFQKKYPGRITHIIVPKVDPIGVSMNRCIERAQADLLAIWNVDDLRTNSSLEAQYRTLIADPQAAIAYGDFTVVKKFEKTEGELVDCSIYAPEELTRSMIVGPFFMFRKSICEQAGYFDEQLKSGADFDFAVRLALHGRAIHCPEHLGYYLNEGLGASTRPNSLQPVERTVVELRYGIYDKIDYCQVPIATARYAVPLIKHKDAWIPVSTFVPDYSHFIESRRDAWFNKGMSSFSRKYLITTSKPYTTVRQAKAAVQKARKG